MNQAESVQTGGLDINRLRQDFPILHQQVNGKPLVYLDNAATTQKPQAVLDAITHYYQADNANVHRGAHRLADRATRDFEAARSTVARFIHAPSERTIIWTKGTTESINLVAHSYGSANLEAGDEVLISAMEHHANIVPWQMLCRRTGAVLKVIAVKPNGELDLDDFHTQLNSRTRILAVTQVSNALGTVNPVAEMIRAAKAQGAMTLIDGAQAVGHWPVDVQALDCDFYAFSGHKLFGPTGIGVLYGREALLDAMPPYQTGGEMIEQVSFSGTTFNRAPHKFEAGTPHIEGAIGLGAAIDYLQRQDRTALAQHEAALLAYATEQAEAFAGLTLVGTAPQKAGVMSFLLEGGHPHDVGTLLDQQGIAIRTGHHCAMPIMEQFQVPGTARASFSFYNTFDEVDALFAGLAKVQQFL